MNLKPTPWKLFISLILCILTNYLIAGSARMNCNCASGHLCDCPPPSWAQFAFHPLPLSLAVVVLILVYSLWSFMQKK